MGFVGGWGARLVWEESMELEDGERHISNVSLGKKGWPWGVCKKVRFVKKTKRSCVCLRARGFLAVKSETTSQNISGKMSGCLITVQAPVTTTVREEKSLIGETLS